MVLPSIPSEGCVRPPLFVAPQHTLSVVRKEPNVQLPRRDRSQICQHSIAVSSSKQLKDSLSLLLNLDPLVHVPVRATIAGVTVSPVIKASRLIKLARSATNKQFHTGWRFLKLALIAFP